MAALKYHDITTGRVRDEGDRGLHERRAVPVLARVVRRHDAGDASADALEGAAEHRDVRARGGAADGAPGEGRADLRPRVGGGGAGRRGEEEHGEVAHC